MAREVTFAVAPVGVGREDYSTGLEHLVEPTIRSYQEVFSHWEEVTFTAGADTVVDITVTTDYVDMVYDYYASIPASVLLDLHVQSIVDGVEGSVVHKSNYGTVHAALPKGFAFLDTIRFTVHNYGDEDIDGLIGALGIETTQSQYYLTLPT